MKVATVKHLWEKVAAIRRDKAVGSEDLKVKLRKQRASCGLAVFGLEYV